MFCSNHYYLTQYKDINNAPLSEFNTDFFVCVSFNQCIVVKAVASLWVIDKLSEAKASRRTESWSLSAPGYLAMTMLRSWCPCCWKMNSIGVHAWRCSTLKGWRYGHPSSTGLTELTELFAIVSLVGKNLHLWQEGVNAAQMGFTRAGCSGKNKHALLSPGKLLFNGSCSFSYANKLIVV